MKVKICSRCVMDSTVPDISFDEHGICSYCKQWDYLDKTNPNDKRGQKIFDRMVRKTKKAGRSSKYDVIVGISGGTDSTYLLHLAKSKGLRVLAVNLDNGWHTEIAVSNIKNCLTKLDIDLYTYVINYEEIKDILLSFMKASLPWIDGPTDIAIVSALYRAAAKFNVKYIWVGNNFRTEGSQPTEWTHIDGRQIKYVQKKFGTKKLKTFPNLTARDLINYGMVKKIKMFRPFYYINYNKDKTKKFISAQYGWVDYGGHHHESIFTRFAIGYWLPKKFGIDKRKVTFSAYIRNGEMARSKALRELKKPAYPENLMEEDREYIIKKLGINEHKFRKIWKSKNKTFRDYPSYYPFYEKYKPQLDIILKRLFAFKPMMTYEHEKTINKHS